jgi:hypothetical protein
MSERKRLANRRLCETFDNSEARKREREHTEQTPNVVS